jgi:hypothetical protein
MSIEKKSLISTLKTTKKANAVSSDLSAKPSTVTTKMAVSSKKMRRAAELHRANVASPKAYLTKRKK